VVGEMRQPIKYLPSIFLSGDAKRPMTTKQKSFYEKRGWSIKGITRRMAFRQTFNWISAREKEAKK